MRHQVILTIAAALVLAAVALPATTAEPGAATAHEYKHADTMTVIYGTPALSTAHDYTLTVDEGQTITASIAYADDVAELDVTLIPPGGSCGIYPELEPICLVDGALQSATCGGDSSGERDPTTFTTTAPVSGEYRVSVRTNLAVPLTEIPYVITISVDDTAPSVSGPETVNYLRPYTYCDVL